MDHDRNQQSASSVGASDGFCFFSSGANSMRGSTTSSESDGKISSTGIGEKCLAVTLMFSTHRNGNHVLFLEAGKDFVDILLSFLTLPMGGIIKLLSSYGGGSHRTTGLLEEEAIFKIYNSVDRMEDDKFCTSKKSLLDPQEASGFGSKLLLPTDDQRHQGPPSSTLDRTNCGSDSYYSCGMVPHCVCITKKAGRRCPRHGRKMQTLCKFVEVAGKGGKSCSSNAANAGKANGSANVKNLDRTAEATGYVKDAGRFFVTDNMSVYPASMSLALLQMLKVERMSVLSSLDLFIGIDEILKLLKASLVSSTVLQDVFGRLVRERLPPPHPPPPSTPSSLVSTPVSTLITTPVSTSTNSFNDVDAFALDRTRPKYDDYFPRPKGLLFL